MNKTYRNILILISTGAVAGILGGLLGIGGGVILVPMLVFFFGFSQHKAHGTSLSALACLSFVGMLGYWSRGLVDWHIAICMIVGGITGATLGGMMVKKIKSKMLRLLFFFLLIFASLRMIMSGFGADMFSGFIKPGDYSFVIQFLIFMFTGLATGILSAILGVGGGLIVVPALVLGLGVDQHIAQGVSLTVMFPTAVTGAYMHFKQGNLDLHVGKWAGLGAALTTLLGLTVAISLKSDVLQMIFGLFVAVIAIMLISRKEKKKTGGVTNE